jgi:hypothetical protein
VSDVHNSKAPSSESIGLMQTETVVPTLSLTLVLLTMFRPPQQL